MKKQYCSIDLFKFICAVLIIVLHTAPLSSYSKLLSFGLRNIITVIAVPFFFISSGFITREKSDYRTDYIKRYTVRILKMYLIWSLIYFPFVVIKWINKGFVYTDISEYIKDFIFEGSYSTIWFLPALLIATLTVFVLHKRFTYLQIFLISLPVYAVTLAGSSYFGLSQKIPFLKSAFDLYYGFFDTVKNGILFGFIFVSLGALISENKDKLKFKASKALFAVIVFWALLAAEQLGLSYFGLNSRGVDTTVMLVPLSFFLFVFVLNLELSENDIYIKMRKLSLLLFLCQRIPITIIELWLNNTVIAVNSLVFFAVVLVSTTAISYGVICLSERFKIFKYLY